LQVVTKQNELAPAIGAGPILESDSSRAARFKDMSMGKAAFRKDDTVTFSFHSAYMDLLEWKVCVLFNSVLSL
jgi:hypothetical protein